MEDILRNEPLFILMFVLIFPIVEDILRDEPLPILIVILMFPIVEDILRDGLLFILMLIPPKGEGIDIDKEDLAVVLPNSEGILSDE
ncbi:MAG: hypothetical protein SW833_13830 [Cyanobacteriota bacterium]|nr:hypothetical protein [Cyanobacteriota bacterium]